MSDSPNNHDVEANISSELDHQSSNNNIEPSNETITDQTPPPLTAPTPATNQPINQPINQPYEPIRTEPVAIIDKKRRKLNRYAQEKIPEIHMIGEIAYGEQMIQEISEGSLCRWKVDIGKSAQHLGGELVGQTQIAYCKHQLTDKLIFSHPIDLHFALSGLQGWGHPKLSFQTFRLDAFGRRILNGYGFVHLPLQPGHHQLTIHLWRPLGLPDQELRAYLLGETPALLTQDPIYDSAWKDRCRLLTTSAGSIVIDLFIMTRYFQEQSIDR